jgi:hypothetical protein
VPPVEHQDLRILAVNGPSKFFHLRSVQLPCLVSQLARCIVFGVHPHV